MKKIGVVLVVIGVIAFVYMLVFDNGTSSPPAPNAPSTTGVAYTAENCVHDLAAKYADAVKRDMDNGVPFSETKAASQLSEYERQKSECYKKY